MLRAVLGLSVVALISLALRAPQAPGSVGAGQPSRSSRGESAQEAVSTTLPTDVRSWTPGRGWGWIWGPDDEVGSLNGLTDASRLRALTLVKRGHVFDLGHTYSRRSFKWPGHNPGEVVSFRSPDGIHRMGDPDAPPRESN